ncbi:MAG: (2Fe-2S)-binding protein [Kofleriaceae bacterium]|nr:(2Fe-2S)-binding protein [Myxococcales bacterium]MCB9562004.1 (2Fe-2S)-binding protein [Kofleriaceae bacterium]
MRSSDGSLIEVHLTVNGDAVRRAVPPERTLAELLREDLLLTGCKQGCDQGDCGACTVLVDGRAQLACLTLVVAIDGATIETVEGLQQRGRLHPLQAAFVAHGAAQCGFCTPGMLLSAVALLRASPRASRDEIRAGLAGNLCRCTGYVKIIDAVEAVARGDDEEPAP